MQSACSSSASNWPVGAGKQEYQVITCIVESALRAACGFRLFARFGAIVIAVLHHVTPW